jgi:hypothetical protein
MNINYGVEREIQKRSPVGCIPFYANLLTGISLYAGNLAMVR